MLAPDVTKRNRAIDVSAIVPVVDRFDDPDAVYFSYRDALARVTERFEFVYVIDGPHPWLEKRIEKLRDAGEPITIVRLPRSFGESVGITVGCEHASGDTILLLPPYLQVDPETIPDLFPLLETADLVAPCRDRHGDVLASRARGKAFELIARLSGTRAFDFGCHVRLFRRAVIEEVELREEQHRFLPILAEHAGFRVVRVSAPQAAADRRYRHHGPRTYLARLLDVVSIAFLLKFIQKPFRFFGAIGLATTVAGLLLGLVLLAEKFVGGVPLGDRPALLLATLLIVLGLQIAAVGLIAEIVIFTRSRARPTYRIDQIVERTPPVEQGGGQR